MPTPDPNNPDEQAANLIAYTLRVQGWIIDTLQTNDAGVALVAHRPSKRGTFLTRPGFRELAD